MTDASRVDAFFERSYQHGGRQFVERFFQLSIVGIVVQQVVGAAIYLRYLEHTSAQAVRTYAVFVGVPTLIAIVQLYPRMLRNCEPITRFVAGDRDEQATRAAWECTRGILRRQARTTMFAAMVTISPPIFLYAWVEYDVPVGGLALGYVGVLAAAAWLTALGAYSSEIWFRPAYRDIALEAGRFGFRDSDVRTSLRNKLLTIFPLATLLTGTWVAVAATVSGGEVLEFARLLLLTVLVAFSTIGVLVVLVAKALTGPIGDVVATTERVRGGDLTARAPVTTDDEIGLLATNLNDMLDDLAIAADEVHASRARILAASDAERRRIERNIHDGAQQRLVALMLRLRALTDHPGVDPSLRDGLDEASAELLAALEDLRSLAQGLHPSVLDTDGLAPALEQLAATAPVPVRLDVPSTRFAAGTESTVYFVASEALANVAKYANATRVTVTVVAADDVLRVEVADDGVGGARIGEGSGLTGLADRVAAVGGRLALDSPPGGGTRLSVELPVRVEQRIGSA